MGFNSSVFIIFFIIVYVLYRVLAHQWQNRMLLLASLVFYGFWDWRFLALLLLSTWIAYACGGEIGKTDDAHRRKFFLVLGISTKLCILGFFKYYNFFAENFQALFNLVGLHLSLAHLNIILPLGISFYTFQTMSYIIDVYRKEVKVTSNFFDFALFGSFFPQLVAGPIERAKHLLPQIQAPRVITREKIAAGCYLLLWGYFLKIFAADNLAKIVDPIFDAAPPYNGMAILLAMYAFTFQIFCDFAGYSSIARGLGLLMGFDIVVNFNAPFFSTNVQEFWNRWHISLSHWIRDYVYLPMMGGLRFMKGNGRVYTALVASMTLIGLWHGAAWNFVLFGIYYGVLLVFYLIIRIRWGTLIMPQSPFGKQLWFWFRVVFIFHLTVIGMMIFRCHSLQQVGRIFNGLFFNFYLTSRFSLFQFLKTTVNFFWAVWLIVVLEYVQFKKQDVCAVIRLPWVVQGIVYFLLIFLLITFGVNGGQEFIYFQF